MATATELLSDSVEAETTASTEIYVEFRCGSCYQVRHEPTRCCGEHVDCPYCQNTNSVPAYEETSLRTAEQVAAASGRVTVQQGQFAQKDYSRDEVEEIAKARAEQSVRKPGYGEAAIGVHAAVMTRALAKIIDVAILGIAMAGSVALGAFLASNGLCPTLEEIAPAINQGDFLAPMTLLCYGAVYGLVNVLFWAMIAILGQTPGTMLFNIKIVNGSGDPPGFLRGVLGRVWVAGLVMNLIPFGSFINYGMASMASPPRCVHDHIAGTYVIQS